MPGKSRNSRGKNYPNSKKGKAKQRSAAGIVPQQVVAETPKAAAPPGVSAASVRVPLSKAKASVAKYPYITAELKRIGILAGIILVILIVLALILS
ncbi:hypothetical protein ACFLUO_06460 [Chloroflexota bacterium]